MIDLCQNQANDNYSPSILSMGTTGDFLIKVAKDLNTLDTLPLFIFLHAFFFAEKH
jgi:hypothetical protein